MFKKIFVCSPYRGKTEEDVYRNIENAKKFCKFVASKGDYPFAPHLLYPRFLDDSDEHERNVGIEAGVAFLEKCDEIWVFANKWEDVSEGMKAEMKVAYSLTKYFSIRDPETFEELNNKVDFPIDWLDEDGVRT